MYKNVPVQSGAALDDGDSVEMVASIRSHLEFNQLRQVFRTYTTHWWFWGIFLYWLLEIIGEAFGPNHWHTVSLTPLIITLILCVMVGIQLKRQFANPRARLLPNFAYAHLLTAALILVTPVVGCALALARASNASAIAAIGLIVPLVSIILWCICFTWELFFPLFILLFVGVLTVPKDFADAIYTNLLNGNPIVFFGGLCLGIAALIALGFRLLALREDMPDYARQLPISTWDITPQAVKRDWRQLASRATDRSRSRGRLLDVLFKLVFRWSPTWQPMHRLLFHQLAGRFSGLIFGVSLIGWLSIIWGILHCLRPNIPITTDNVFILWFFPFLFISASHGFMYQHLPYLARESLLPVDRKDFVRDIFRSSAFDTATIIMAFCASIILWLVFLNPNNPSTSQVLLLLAMIVVQCSAGHCLILWLVSFRRLWISLIGITAFWILSAGAASMAVFAGALSLGYLAMAAVVSVIIVVTFYRLAFRRWCNIELG
jgi:hypothetical protein